MPAKGQLEIEGEEIEVSNLDKMFYPQARFTKSDVIHFYIQISKYLLPHLRNRALTLKRYPDGAEGFFFYEKQCPPHPAWVATTKVSRSDGSQIDYCVINNLRSLVWAANLADLELHTFLHLIKRERPTAVAFDLDPGPPAGILNCCEVALRLKAMLDSLGLKSFPKTSGSKGLQVYVPLNTAANYDQTKEFANAMAQLLEQQLPDKVVSLMQKNLRGNKVFVDWSQNDSHKTTVNVYSLRAKEHPFVSTPLAWSEVESAFKKRSAKLLQFQAKQVVQRVEKLGDLFAPVLVLKQKLPKPKTFRS
jgi:bifunctional non-homologous end joining protein LigD